MFPYTLCATVDWNSCHSSLDPLVLYSTSRYTSPWDTTPKQMDSLKELTKCSRSTYDITAPTSKTIGWTFSQLPSSLTIMPPALRPAFHPSLPTRGITWSLTSTLSMMLPHSMLESSQQTSMNSTTTSPSQSRLPRNNTRPHLTTAA